MKFTRSRVYVSRRRAAAIRAARDELIDHVVLQQAAFAPRGVAKPEACAAPEARLAIGVAARHGREVRAGHDRARPHDFVEAGKLDLELDDRARGRCIVWAFEAEAERREVAHRGVVEIVVIGGDGAEPVDGDPRRAATYVEKIHRKIVEDPGPRTKKLEPPGATHGRCARSTRAHGRSRRDRDTGRESITPRSLRARTRNRAVARARISHSCAVDDTSTSRLHFAHLVHVIACQSGR